LQLPCLTSFVGRLFSEVVPPPAGKAAVGGFSGRFSIQTLRRAFECMQKQTKTRWELATIIASRAGVSTRSIAVFHSTEFGWDANLITAPPQAFRARRLVKEIVEELRAKYELSEEPNVPTR
jgi:hypothetical protein